MSTFVRRILHLLDEAVRSSLCILDHALISTTSSKWEVSPTDDTVGSRTDLDWTVFEGLTTLVQSKIVSDS